MWLQVKYDYGREVTTGLGNMDVMSGLIRANSAVESKEHNLY